jgi:hypothetical protein
VKIDVDNQEDPSNPGTQVVRFRCSIGQEAAMQQAVEQARARQMSLQPGEMGCPPLVTLPDEPSHQTPTLNRSQVQHQINFQHQMNIQHGITSPGQGHAGFGGHAPAAPMPPSFAHAEPMTENARKLAETCRQFVTSGGPGGAARGGAPPLSLLEQQVAALQPRTNAAPPPQQQSQQQQQQQPQPQQPQQQQQQQPQQQQPQQQQQGWGAPPADSLPLRSGLPPSIDPVALRAALACLGGAAARLPASLAADLATAELAPQLAPQSAPQLAPQPGDDGGGPSSRDPSLADGGGLPPESSTTCDPALSITVVPECGSALGNEDETVHAESGSLKVQRTA